MSSRHTDEFSKRALVYTQNNIIQKQVVQKLLNNMSSKPKNILDLGSGEGAVFRLVDWSVDRFVGVDKAENMCALHPKPTNVTILNEDFETLDFDQLGHFDIIIASSALQWAKDLDSLLAKISQKSNEVAFAIFCDGTFKAIYEQAGLEKFLPNADTLLNTLERFFDFTHERVEYHLEFSDNLSKFRYIKNSGVSGGARKLNYLETKNLIENYPYNYLEFEVMFVWGKPKVASSFQCHTVHNESV